MRKDIALLTLIIAALVAGLAVLFLNVSFLPPLASEQGVSIDDTMKLLFAIAAGIFAIIFAFIVYSAVRFRHRAGDTADGPPIQSNVLWVAAFFFVPAALVIWSATVGAVELKNIQQAHEDEMEVSVTAVKWAWRFDYPEFGVSSSELVLPVNRPVVFKITSRDVLHSFWVPEWRPKIDALPGTETELRITPTQLGEFRVRCAELCGLGHTGMLAPVTVVTPEEFLSRVEEMRR